MAWANESFYYLQQTRNIIKSFYTPYLIVAFERGGGGEGEQRLG